MDISEVVDFESFCKWIETPLKEQPKQEEAPAKPWVDDPWPF